jgi:hypothetical protein
VARSASFPASAVAVSRVVISSVSLALASVTANARSSCSVSAADRSVSASAGEISHSESTGAALVTAWCRSAVVPTAIAVVGRRFAEASAACASDSRARSWTATPATSVGMVA